MAKKYLKNESGIVRAITSDNLQLEKPLLNENYDIEVHNRNMDKIDSAIQEVNCHLLLLLLFHLYFLNIF